MALYCGAWTQGERIPSSSCVRRVFRLPINTFTYLVEGHLTQGLAPLRNLVMGRYPAFYQKMAWSPCRKVAVLAQVVAGADAPSL